MAMYKTNTKVRHERETIITDAISASNSTFTFYEFKNKRIELPVIRLDITVPIYRMANYRTRTAQLKYIHDRKVKPDFFSNGQENESAQQAQHDILTVFAKEGRANSISPIITELENEEQREPLLVTRQGMVVNGNRRLAAMRELFADRPGEFKHFSHVDCAVLPADITPDDIREIEVRLQMRPETKLPYGWIDECIAIKEMFDSGKNADYISGLMNKKPKDAERSARALTEVDIYLRDWLRSPGEYQLVNDTEQFFKDMVKALEGVEGDILEAKRRIAWALISNSESLNRRVYEYNFSFDKNSDEVISELSSRLSIDLTPSDVDAGSDEDFDIDLGTDGNEEDTSLDAFIDAFDDLDQRDKIGEELIDVCETIYEKNRQGSIGNQALNAVKAANTKLMSVDLSKADPQTYKAIEAQLANVTARVKELEDALEPYNSGNDGADE